MTDQPPTLPEGVSIRPGTEQDVPTFLQMRIAMFLDMREGEPDELKQIMARFDAWLRPKMATGQAGVWLAIAGDGPIASAAAWTYDWYPRALPPANDRHGYIFNIYVKPPWRRQGLAKALTRTAMDWLEAQGITHVHLHSSDEGRGVYTALGFRQTSDMRTILGKEPDES